MTSLSQTEKNIYNLFLKVSRTVKNQPFKYRENFDKFEDEDAFQLKKIANFFSRFPHVNMHNYFKAPYVIHPDEDYFPLSYFAGMAAIKTYNVFMKQLQQKDPDSPEQLEFILTSLKLIARVCHDHKIKLADYPTLKTNNSSSYEWMKQINKHEISIYALMEFESIFEIIKEVPEDEIKFLLGDIGTYFHSFKQNYLKSKDAQYLVKNGIKKIDKIMQ